MSSPPATNESWLRLSFAAMPTARAREALQHFDSPQKLLDCAVETPEQLQQYRLSKGAIEKLQLAARRDVSRQLEAMEAHDISVASEADYPPLLTEIEDNTPPFLFARGSFAPADARCISIVGTRNVTEYGRGLAHRFALEFARAGWTVVSGLARGIDTAAHRGALDGGGRTIAVTACGLDLVYPPENRELMMEIEKNGALVSEWAPTTPPAPWHFPARNRIISGLSCALVVVEAQPKSGALISADYSMEWGRDVFAVPGNVHKPQSHGPHALIKDKAHLAESAQDVLEWLGNRYDLSPFETPDFEVNAQSHAIENAEPASPNSRRVMKSNPAPLEKSETAAKEKPQTSSARAPKTSAPRAVLAPDENKMWLALDVEPRHLDDIAADAGLEMRAANSAIVMLEIKGVAKKLPGNLFVKVV